MRLIRQSPQELVLLHRPVVLCAVLVAGTLMLLAVTLWNLTAGDWFKAGLAFLCALGLMGPALWFAAERVDVIFDATSQTLTIKTRRLSGAYAESHPLSRVTRAMLQTHKGPSDSAGSHRVALVFEPERLEDRRALTTGYASGRGAAEIVARINTWLDAARTDTPA